MSYLDNGTAINLAKVRGSVRYAEIMERMMRTGTSPWKRCWYFGRCGPFDLTRGDFRTLRRFLGCAASPEAGVFGHMVSRLRAASEEALGPEKPIKCVAVTAPWMQMGRDDYRTEKDLVDAIYLAGLEPCSNGDDVDYIGESQAVLGANDLWTCQPYGMGDIDEDRLVEGLFFIRCAGCSLPAPWW